MPSKKTFNKVALRVEGPIFDKNLGKLEFGYAILEKDVAHQWILKFPDKVKEVIPQEVAAAYGTN